MELATFDRDRDLDAAKRVWKEVGWVRSIGEAGWLADFLDGSDCVVARVDGEAECVVVCANGSIRYEEFPDNATDLSMCAVTAVTTSHVARRLGAARRLTALSLAEQAQSGAEVARLGMFDQGFYDTVGFGTGNYVNRFMFDPSQLKVTHPFRAPKRLTKDDWSMMRKAMIARKRGHGSCVVLPEGFSKGEIQHVESPFGLGYFDGSGGELTHFIWGEAEAENGPYSVEWIAYQTTDQLFELLALIRSLGDQVYSVHMQEPAELQFQDLIDKPFRNERSRRGSKFETYQSVFATEQLRILNLQSCIEKTRLQIEDIRFNLVLDDPVRGFVDDDHNWQGISGDYVVTLGESSFAESGNSPNLPTLSASVGAFSRMWFGIRDASSLALTDTLDAPIDLLEDLDRGIRLPTANSGWEF